MADRPPQLNQYILRKQREATEGNQADHRPTFQTQLNTIAKDSTELYTQGLALIASIPATDLERCRKLCAARQGNSFGLDELIQARIKDRRVVVPKYVALIDEVENLKEILK
ncbi:MAG TPA: hypothetical protein VGN56_01750 [Candidatus Paceibacterota bacterium]|nr:hypothetical protein [Candidatus Paceibacterota bacterium]